MQPIRRLTCAALLLAATGLAGASPSAGSPDRPKEGADFLTLPDPQPLEGGKKIEVTEFFAYYCPHCYAFEPQLAAWVKKQGDNVVLRRVHVSAGGGALAQQRLFYTLDAMGLLEQYHAKVFEAMHVKRLRLGSDEQVIDWAAQAGIDRAQFIATYNSFGIQARLRRAGAMMDAYGVEYWPMVVVDGRFVTSPSMANPEGSEAKTEIEQQQVALQVMDALVEKAKAAKADKK